MSQLIKASSAAYHRIDRLSSSRLAAFLESREDYHARYVAKTKSRPMSDAFIVGGAVHALVLEGRKAFEEEYVSPPEKIDRRTKAGKQQFAEWQKAAEGKIVLSSSQWDTVQGVVESLSNHGMFIHLMRGGSYSREQAMLFELHGVECKAKPDLYGEFGGQPCLIDIKTTANAHPSEFIRKSYEYGYATRLAFYLEGVIGLPQWSDAKFEDWRCMLVACSKDKPYVCSVYEYDTDYMALGRSQVHAIVRDLAVCHKTGKWESPWSSQIQTIRCPSWARLKEETHVDS